MMILLFMLLITSKYSYHILFFAACHRYIHRQTTESARSLVDHPHKYTWGNFITYLNNTHFMEGKNIISEILEYICV